MTTSAARRYRFGFVLSTGGGNLTRYLTLRKFAERDSEVECVWAPNPGYLEPDPFAWAPPILRQRLMVMRLARPVLRELATFDAVMFHAFEPYALASLRSLLARRPVIVWSQDDPPTKDPRFWRTTASSSARPGARACASPSTDSARVGPRCSCRFHPGQPRAWPTCASLPSGSTP